MYLGEYSQSDGGLGLFGSKKKKRRRALAKAEAEAREKRLTNLETLIAQRAALPAAPVAKAAAAIAPPTITAPISAPTPAAPRITVSVPAPTPAPSGVPKWAIPAAIGGVGLLAVVFMATSKKGK